MIGKREVFDEDGSCSVSELESKKSNVNFQTLVVSLNRFFSKFSSRITINSKKSIVCGSSRLFAGFKIYTNYS